MQSPFHALTATILLALAVSLPRLACAQTHNPDIDVLHYSFNLSVNDANDSIRGNAAITLVFRQKTDSFQLDLAAPNTAGKGMKVLAIQDSKGQRTFRQKDNTLTIRAPGDSGKQAIFLISYTGIPADGLIIARNMHGSRGFFGDNWPNRAHNWLPCVDHPSDKASVEFLITAPDHYTVVANGKLISEKKIASHQKITHWSEPAPLSPKIMVVGIADFAVGHPGDVDGIPVWNYVYKQDSAIGLQSYAHALKILPFYISHIGPYPFQKCGNVQSKTRFGGLENAGAIFYFEQSITTPGIESLMAHEIAHQWFGDAATETEWRHLWLSEGFATYMTHCYLENTYGPDTLKGGMKKDRDQVFAYDSKHHTAIVDTSVHDDYMQLLNPNSYQKAGWVLHMLRRKIGDSLFWRGISTYYTRYRNSNASSEDFISTIDSVSGLDLHSFFHQWLDRPGHPHLRIIKGVKNNQLEDLEIQQLQDDTYYQFTFEYTIDGKLYRTDIKDKITNIPLPKLPANAKIEYDPGINLLAEIETMSAMTF